MSSDGVFMSIAAALNAESKSFEEVRLDDYLKSFTTTGRPPAPVPQEPTDEFQRKAMNLPPLFKPQTSLPAPSGSSSSSSTSLLPSLLTPSALKPRIVNAADIPLAQEFRLHTVATEKYQCISCIPEYEGFSPDELRYYAYFRGNIQSPVPIVMDPFVPVAKATPASAPAGPSEDKLESQVAQPAFNRHSPEELRVAFIFFGREMTSTDLLGPQVLPPPAPTTTAPPTLLIRPPTAIQPPVIAAAAPTTTTPRFSFGFR